MQSAIQLTPLERTALKALAAVPLDNNGPSQQFLMSVAHRVPNLFVPDSEPAKGYDNLERYVKTWRKLADEGLVYYMPGNDNYELIINLSDKGAQALGRLGVRRSPQEAVGAINQILNPDELRPGIFVLKYNLLEDCAPVWPALRIMSNPTYDEKGEFVEYITPFRNADGSEAQRFGTLYLEEVGVVPDKWGLYHPWTVLGRNDIFCYFLPSHSSLNL